MGGHSLFRLNTAVAAHCCVSPTINPTGTPDSTLYSTLLYMHVHVYLVENGSRCRSRASRGVGLALRYTEVRRHELAPLIKHHIWQRSISTSTTFYGHKGSRAAQYICGGMGAGWLRIPPHVPYSAALVFLFPPRRAGAVPAHRPLIRDRCPPRHLPAQSKVGRSVPLLNLQ